MDTMPTHHLPPGQLVYTSQPTGSDFGLPIVEPHARIRDRATRTVRNVVKCRGGHVVWFTDGTKTNPLHGRTVWMIAAPPVGDPQEGEE